MSQMQLLVGAALPGLFYGVPIAAIAAIGFALTMRESSGPNDEKSVMTRGLAGAGVAIALAVVARALGGNTGIANALAISGVAGSVLAVLVLWLTSRSSAKGSSRAAGLMATGLAVLEVSAWVWALSMMGHRFGVPDGEWVLVTYVLLGSSIGSALVTMSVCDAADARVAWGMDVFTTIRAMLVGAVVIAACTAFGMGELADGERRQFAMRLVVAVLSVAGAGVLASLIASKFARGGLGGAVVAGIIGIAGTFGALWFGLRDESSVSALNLALCVSAGAAASVVFAWRSDVGMGALAVGVACGWLLARMEESDALGLFGVAMVGVGFVMLAAPQMARSGAGQAEAGGVRRFALGASAVAGLVLVVALVQVARVQQTLVGAELGRTYPRTNYKDGTFVGKVDIAGPHGIYTGNAMFALIFPGAGPNHSTIYDAGMIDRSRLQEHVLETLMVGMIFPLSIPGAEDHGHDEHAEHDHEHDHGHDHDPAAARARVLEMTGEVSHGDHGHAYTQDLIASRHAQLGDVLAFHGGSLGDGRLLAGLMAGLAMMAFVAGSRLTGVWRMIAVGVVAGLVTMALGIGGACGLIAGATLAAVGAGWGTDSARGASLSSVVKAVAFVAITLAVVVVRNGALLG